MRIMLITTSFPDGEDGREAAGSFVRDFAQALSEHCDVLVVTPGLHPGDGFNGKVRTVRFMVPRLPLSLLSPVNPSDWAAILVTLSRGKQSVRDLGRHWQPDHILALWALPSGYWAATVAAQLGIGYSVWALGSDIWGLGKIPLVRQVLRRVLRGASHRFADGRQLQADVEKIGGMSAGFLASGRDSVVCGLSNPGGPKLLRFVFLGRWHPNKGVDLLLRALAELSEADWKHIDGVRIAGGGPLAAEVSRAVEALSQQGRPVGLQGFLDRSAAFELLLWSDYVLIPSRVESIPVIFSDAMQARRPVLAMPVGDLPKLISQYQCGRVADEVSVDGMLALLKGVFDRPIAVTGLQFEVISRVFNPAANVGVFLSAVGDNVMQYRE